MTTVFKPSNLIEVAKGDKLSNIYAIIEAIQNNNGSNSAYNITALGTANTNAQQLTAVINQVDFVNANTGVALPSSSGKVKSAYQLCIVINNGANTLNVYGKAGSIDTINGIAGSTGVLQAAATTNLYISAKQGAWFSISGSGGSGNTIVTLSISADTLGGNASNTEYYYNGTGTFTFTLPSALNNTNPYTVRNAGTGVITVITSDGQTINGSSQYIISGQYVSRTFRSDTANWGITV